MADAWEEIRRLAADFQRAQFTEAAQRCRTFPLHGGVQTIPWAATPNIWGLWSLALDSRPSQPVTAPASPQLPEPASGFQVESFLENPKATMPRNPPSEP